MRTVPIPEPVDPLPAKRGHLQRRPVKRAFTGLAGSPLAEAQPSVPEPSVHPPTLDMLIEKVGDAKTKGQVRKTLHETLSPSVEIKRGRGRPRKWTSDAERKRSARAEERQKFTQLLEHFGLSLDSEIDSQLRDAFKITAKTYRELLNMDRLKTALVRAVANDVKRRLKEQRQDQQSTGDGQFMRAAPQGRGKLHSGGYDSRKTDTIKGIRDEQERGLSKPGDFELELFGESEFKPMGDRRKVRPKGAGPDEYEAPPDE